MKSDQSGLPHIKHSVRNNSAQVRLSVCNQNLILIVSLELMSVCNHFSKSSIEALYWPVEDISFVFETQ